MSIRDDRSYITWPTLQKYDCAVNAVEKFDVRTKRRIFNMLRTPGTNHNTLLVEHGITAGFFSVAQVIIDNRRPKRVLRTKK